MGKAAEKFWVLGGVVALILNMVLHIVYVERRSRCRRGRMMKSRRACVFKFLQHASASFCGCAFLV